MRFEEIPVFSKDDMSRGKYVPYLGSWRLGGGYLSQVEARVFLSHIQYIPQKIWGTNCVPRLIEKRTLFVRMLCQRDHV